ALRVPALVAQFGAESKGIGSGFNRLYTDRFGALSMPVPPPQDQGAIVRYVKNVDRQVNRFITNKRRLAELLHEQREAIVLSAVSLGLSSDHKLASSANGWTVEHPAAWDEIPFVRCAIERADYRGATPEKVESGVFLVTAKNVRMGWIDYETSKEF